MISANHKIRADRFQSWHSLFCNNLDQMIWVRGWAGWSASVNFTAQTVQVIQPINKSCRCLFPKTQEKRKVLEKLILIDSKTFTQALHKKSIKLIYCLIKCLQLIPLPKYAKRHSSFSPFRWMDRSTNKMHYHIFYLRFWNPVSWRKIVMQSTGHETLTSSHLPGALQDLSSTPAPLHCNLHKSATISLFLMQVCRK